MNKRCRIFLSAMLLLATPAAAGELIWQSLSESQARNPETNVRDYRVDVSALHAILQRVTVVNGPGSERTISLPMPDGSLAEFEIYESPVMSTELARRYPEIKTYKVYGVDDPQASGRLNMTPQGIHGMLHTSLGRMFIDPQPGAPQSDRYRASTSNTSLSSAYFCGVDDHASSMTPVSLSAARPAARIRGRFLQYRLAVAATAEYVDAVSPGSVANAYIEITNAITEVNEIYERDLGIQLLLVSGDELIEDGGNVAFTDSDPVSLFRENQAWIDSVIGRSSYDIGHVFSTGSGGLAWLGSACDRSNKAKGVSGIPNPVGNPFYIDFVAHEIGHQLNAEHSFNGTTQSCATGRNQATAFEPGSGSTIMAYAGICGVEDLQLNSDATFHAGSIAQIDSFTANAGSCFTEIAPVPANPNYPVVAALTSRNIPANTAFELEGAASDADTGQILSYQWDQMDVGCPTNAASFGTDTGYNALFRSYLPRSSAKRHFPALGTQLQGLYDDAEVMPCNTRDINLRLTARDGLSGIDSKDMRVSVQDTGAAFEILNLASTQTFTDGVNFPVNWRVAGTDQPPINCANVDIELLTFAEDVSGDYESYSVHLLSTTPNNGSANVSIAANESHPRARIRVKCSDNVFYDISDADLAFVTTDPTPVVLADNAIAVMFNNNGTTGSVAPVCGPVAFCESPVVASTGVGDRGGSGTFDYRWLLLSMAILLLSALRRRGWPIRVDSES